MKVAVLTTSRADYGLLEKLIGRIDKDHDTELCLIVSGSHVCPEFGMTIDKIKFPIHEEIPIILSSDTSTAVSKAIGLGCISFSDALERQKPDWVVLLGDRFETFAMAVAAHTLRVPIAHIHGGEVTAGAIDDGFRHSITKMAYLHFTCAEGYRKRVIQLGEHPERVFDVGSLGLEDIEKYKYTGKRRGYLVSIHPETLRGEKQYDFVDDLLTCLADKRPLYFTKSHGDNGSRIINRKIVDFVGADNENRKLFNLNRHDFLRLLARVRCIIGNSSAGILEAPSLGTPTIDIGNRQDGRLKAKSVINCPSTEYLRLTFAFVPYLIGKPVFSGGPVSGKILMAIKHHKSVNLQKGFYEHK